MTLEFFSTNNLVVLKKVTWRKEILDIRIQIKKLYCIWFIIKYPKNAYRL